MTQSAGKYLYILMLCLIGCNICFAFDGGTGDPNNPYQISTPEHLISIGSNPDLLDKHYVMVADVNMDEYVFDTAVIAPDGDNIINPSIPGFSGSFNGDFYSVKNLTIDASQENDPNDGLLGLFGAIEQSGIVENLGVENIKIIRKVSFDAFNTIVGGNGGMTGGNSGIIRNCFSTGEIYADCIAIGGLAGGNSGQILESYSTVSITGKATMVGGLVGNNSDGNIVNCYSKGIISGEWQVGGFAGYNEGTITNCYSTSHVKKASSMGGFLGHGNFELLTGCFWDLETAGFLFFVSIDKSKTTLEMQTESTFTDAGWDFSSEDGNPAVWKMIPGWYPVLSWQVILEVPNIVNLTKEQAEQTLKSEDLILGEISYELSNSVPRGHVINSFPNNSGLRPEGEKVSITISLGNGQFAKGSGIPEDPYQLSCPEDILILGKSVNNYDRHFILTNDIEMSEYSFTTAVIAPDVNNLNFDEYDGTAFSGTFDGNGYSINNLTIDTLADITFTNDGNRFLGLFGLIDQDGTIKNLTINDAIISGNNNMYNINPSLYLGCLAGLSKGSIDNCCINGEIYGTGFDVGGLTGCNEGNITKCTSTSTVNGDCHVGCLVGFNDGHIDECYAQGNISNGIYLGGLTGMNNIDGIITSCYSKCFDSKGNAIGGLVGINMGHLTECNSAGNIIESTEAGGLVGLNGGLIEKCHSTTSVNGDISIGGLVGNNAFSGSISKCGSSGIVNGYRYTGGLVGSNESILENS